jgi:hypothetical protein
MYIMLNDTYSEIGALAPRYYCAAWLSAPPPTVHGNPDKLGRDRWTESKMSREALKRGSTTRQFGRVLVDDRWPQPDSRR